MRGISGLDEELVASHGVLCSMQLAKQSQCYKTAVIDTCSFLRCHCRWRHLVTVSSSVLQIGPSRLWQFRINLSNYCYRQVPGPSERGILPSHVYCHWPFTVSI